MFRVPICKWNSLFTIGHLAPFCSEFLSVNGTQCSQIGKLGFAFLKINGTRMGKSEQNFIFLREALDKYPAEVIRHFLISAHYRHPLDYSLESLKKSESALRRLKNCLDTLEKYATDIDDNDQANDPTDNDLLSQVETAKTRFIEAMDTDFNTAQAMGVIFSLVSHINRTLTIAHNDVDNRAYAKAYKVLSEICHVLGIYNPDSDDVRNGEAFVNPLIDLLLEIRQDARDQKDWETSDKIRDKLKELNIEIQDTREGATWKIIS